MWRGRHGISYPPPLHLAHDLAKGSVQCVVLGSSLWKNSRVRRPTPTKGSREGT